VQDGLEFGMPPGLWTRQFATGVGVDTSIPASVSRWLNFTDLFTLVFGPSP
jgi:hypothetical protein